MTLDIRLYGDACLRKSTARIDGVNAGIRSLTTDMVESMKAAGGVGLAAPQVGKSLKLCVIRHPELQKRPLILINPEIIEKSDEFSAVEEGCLSVPQLNVLVPRPRAVRVRYQDLKGRPAEREFEDLLARIVQHECDHLDGRMIVDHMDLQARLQFEACLKHLRASQKPS